MNKAEEYRPNSVTRTVKKKADTSDNTVFEQNVTPGTADQSKDNRIFLALSALQTFAYSSVSNKMHRVNNYK